MKTTRGAGILLHPTSLPGPYGIGDVGPEAHRWLTWLDEAGFSVWQVLPLGPTGFGDSPYQCFSAFAGNPLLISPEQLMDDGLLMMAECELPRGADERVDYGSAIACKEELLEKAFWRFTVDAPPALKKEFDVFTAGHAHWLDDHALFMALKRQHQGRSWLEWDAPLARRDPAAIAAARERCKTDIEAERFAQFVFFRQWGRLRDAARARGVRLVGDVPIFVSTDSADVWAHPGLFVLGEDGRPSVVAGVPPDLFSSTGQLWGNPLYRWDVMEKDGWAWWIARVRAALELVDVIRLDHFIGFVRTWEVPAGAATAERGTFRAGPGARIFRAIRAALGTLPILAEDLGLVTPAVTALREELGLPGMKVLQFGFGGDEDNPHLPHHHAPASVVYTGTHDNDTLRGWYGAAGEEVRDHVRRYLQCDDRAAVRALVRAAMASVAETAVVPLQDVLELGSEARMNHPGRAEGNWSWRFRWDQVTGERTGWVRELTALYGRVPREVPAMLVSQHGA